jgi:integrase/recombinase XerD
MTRLRKMMLEELQRRNFSEDTIRRYIHTVEDFARHFNRPPDRLGLRPIREYQAHLFQKRKLSSGSVTNHLAALRFFYIQTLKKAWSVTETPEPSPSSDPQPGRSRTTHRCRRHSLPSHSAHDALRYRSAAC